MISTDCEENVQHRLQHGEEHNYANISCQQKRIINVPQVANSNHQQQNLMLHRQSLPVNPHCQMKKQ